MTEKMAMMILKTSLSQKFSDRFGSPQDIANCVAFLSSDLSKIILTKKNNTYKLIDFS